ncbi:unnamed protein product, partial [Musa acuminata subsp. burmannicoides]
RYHYNVADVRLAQHIEKGNEDGLFISCVASCSNLWALIMDAGTGFTAQVYELSANFLHKEWIMEQWEKDYYISALAGANNGSSLVIMSKGTPYSQQSYKVSESFPFKWINKKWWEGFMSMQWQQLELDGLLSCLVMQASQIRLLNLTSFTLAKAFIEDGILPLYLVFLEENQYMKHKRHLEHLLFLVSM